MMEQITLFGKVLEIDEALMNGIKLRMYMMEVGRQLQLRVQKTFDSTSDIYEWLEIGSSVVDIVYEGLYGAGIDYLHGHGITEFDKKDIELIVCEFLSKYEDLHLSIVLNKIHNEKELRKRGLEGERKKKEKKNLEKKFFLETQREFLDACFTDALKLVQMIGDVIHFTDIPLRLIEDEDVGKGVELFELLKKIKSDVKQAYEIAYKIYEVNPTEQKYYEYCMLEFPEETDNLLHLQQIIGLPLQKSVLEKAVKKMFEKMPHNTEEETLLIKNKLENIQKEVDISNNKIVKKVDKLLYDFDIQERTFCDILFDTREMKSTAEKDFNKLDVMCGDIAILSEEECEKKKEMISEEDAVIEIKQIFFERLDNRINHIWMGEDSEKLLDIFIKTDIYNPTSIVQSISNINMIGRTTDKNRYINALSSINADNLKSVRAYKKWKDKKSIEKYRICIILLVIALCLMPFGIGYMLFPVSVILFLIQLIRVNKMKKVWNLLTLNGEVIHPQILLCENTKVLSEESYSVQDEKEIAVNKTDWNNKKKPIYKRIWFWILIAFIGVVGCVAFSSSLFEETKKLEEKNTFAEMDFEELIGKSEEDLEKIGLKLDEDYIGYSALDGDIEVSCTDETIDLIMITGDIDTTPAFHGVRLGMQETEIKEKLSDKYTEEFEGMYGKMYVNLDNGDTVNCQIEDGRVTTIMYTKLSEEDIYRLYRSSMTEEFIFPNSDVKYLSEDEVRSVEADQLSIGRNEIFARHGYIFKDESLRQHFESTSWYEGTVTSDQFNADSVFNDFEKKNVELIKKIENEINGTPADEFIGLGGVYICTTPQWDDFTGKIELGEPQNGAMSFSMGLLEQSYSILTGTAVILDSSTAQIRMEGITITLSWSNSENMYVTSEINFDGMDAGTIEAITNGMSYIRPTEFNQW